MKVRALCDPEESLLRVGPVRWWDDARKGGACQTFTNCGTIAQLEANGYTWDSNVTLVIVTATATRWVAEAQHDSGGSAYRYDTETGQITPIPRS